VQQSIQPLLQDVHPHSNPQPVSSLPGQGPTAGSATHWDEYGPLPSNWERRQDHLGRNYYVDHNTRTTTWHRPSFNQVVNSAEHHAEANQARDHHNRHQLQHIHPNSNTQPASSLPGQGPTTGSATHSDEWGPLPSNWEIRQDHLGRNYYVDNNTRTTTWYRPSFNQS